jgi:hypothetical protein
MSTQVITGKICTTGPKGYLEVPMKTTVTDGTQTEILTDSAFSVTSQSLGIYAERQTVTGAFMTAKTGLIYCAIINNGIVRATIPITSRTSGATGCSDMAVMGNIVLNPGDQVLVTSYA